MGGYAPNDGRLAYLSPVDPQKFTGNTLWVETPGGAPRVLVRGKGLHWLRWSPDGTRIAYNQGGLGIYVVDVGNGSITRVATGNTVQWVDNHTLAIGPGR